MKSKSIYSLLFEEESKINNAPESNVKLTSTSAKARKNLNSVDKQIDALLLRYESSSIIEEGDLNEALFRTSLKILLEQEEEAEGGEEGGEESAEETDTDATDADSGTSGAEGIKADKPGSESIPNLDVDDFTGKCVRLIMNYKNLLRVEEAIINRIRNFLDNNYGDEHVERFLTTLENDYGLSASEFESDEADNNIPEKFTAGASGGGGGGG
jgi:hypothetical protein